MRQCSASGTLDQHHNDLNGDINDYGAACQQSSKMPTCTSPLPHSLRCELRKSPIGSVYILMASTLGEQPPTMGSSYARRATTS